MKILVLATLLALSTLSAEAASPATAQQNALNHFAFRGDQRSQQAFLAVAMSGNRSHAGLSAGQFALVFLGGSVGILGLFGLIALGLKNCAPKQ